MRNLAPARFKSSGRPRRPPGPPAAVPPEELPGLEAPWPWRALPGRFTRGAAPRRSICLSVLPARDVPSLGLHPRSSSRFGSLTVHQSSHVLVSSPQVRTRFGSARGRRGGRGARDARAVDAGTRGAAARAGGRGRGGSRPAVVSARQVAPSSRPQARTRHARCAPPAQPSALRPVHRRLTARPPRWPRASHSSGPMGAAPRARRPMGAPLGPGGGRSWAGRGGLPRPLPQSPARRRRTQRPPPPPASVSTTAMAASSALPGGPASLRTTWAQRGECRRAASPPWSLVFFFLLGSQVPLPLPPPPVLLTLDFPPSPQSCSRGPVPSLLPMTDSARGPEAGPFHSFI